MPFYWYCQAGTEPGRPEAQPRPVRSGCACFYSLSTAVPTADNARYGSRMIPFSSLISAAIRR